MLATIDREATEMIPEVAHLVITSARGVRIAEVVKHRRPVCLDLTRPVILGRPDDQNLARHHVKAGASTSRTRDHPGTMMAARPEGHDSVTTTSVIGRTEVVATSSSHPDPIPGGKEIHLVVTSSC